MGSFLTFWGPNGLFLGLREGSKTVFGSTHVVEQLSFSMLPLLLTLTSTDDFGFVKMTQILSQNQMSELKET